MIKNAKIRRKNMKKAAIKLTILSIMLLVSISGIVLGATYGNTNVPNENTSDTTNVTGGQNVSDVVVDTSNVTDQSATDNVTDQSTADNVTDQSTADNVTATEPGVTMEPTPGIIVDTVAPTAPQDTVPLPVNTPKSPGFESVGAVALLLLAMYVSKRK
jgi:hypothetical protein